MTASAFGLTFHHLGLAVPEMATASVFLTAQGYLPTASVFDPLQSADLAMWRHPTAPDVEVICPSPPGEGAVATILSVRPEGLVYHLCYTTQALDESLDRLEQAGLRAFEVRPRNPPCCSAVRACAST